MILSYHVLFIVASCLFLTHVYASIIVDDRYSPINDVSAYDTQAHDPSNDQVFVARRAAHFIFPPTAFISPSNRPHTYLDFVPAKRQSFGRKHHWDAFFGRRR